MKNIILVGSSLLIAVFLCSCIHRNTGCAVAVNPLNWDSGNPAVLEVVNKDTVSLQDITLFFNSEPSLADHPIPLFIKVMAPDSSFFEEPFTFIAESRKRLPTGNFEISSVYRTDNQLKQTGKYIFFVYPSKEELNGLFTVGLRFD